MTGNQEKECWLAENYERLRAISMWRAKHNTSYAGEDALHDALVYTWDYWDMDRDPSPLILQNVTRRLIAQSKRPHNTAAKCIPLESWDGGVDDLEERLVALLDAKEILASADQMIDQLTGREQAVLRLLRAGYTNKEIADILDTTQSAIKSAAFRVRQRLREVA